MSANTPRNSAADRRHVNAAVFAALGDETRLAILAKLCEGNQVSITQLASNSPLTRQAITKHLRVLQKAGMVRGVRAGRESLFEFRPKPVKEASHYLDVVSKQWDQALSRLKAFVERDNSE